MPSFTVNPATGVCYLPARFDLQLGGSLGQAQLGYEWVGPKDAPLVLVLGGISAGRHVCSHAADPRPGWWEELVGPGRAIDTEAYAVLGVDYLGGVGVSTGPAPGAPSFPRLTPADQVAALALLLEHLGVARLHALVGASFGGMVGLEFGRRHPQRVERLVCLAAAHEPHPMGTAWRGLQRRILELGVDTGQSAEAVVLARALAMTTYRSHEEFAARFAPQDDAAQPEVLRYLQARGEAFAREFSPLSFCCLSEAIDLHRTPPEQVAAPVHLLGFEGDQLVPAAQLQDLSGRLPRLGSFAVLPSRFGHDGFLKEVEALAPRLRSILHTPAELPARPGAASHV